MSWPSTSSVPRAILCVIVFGIVAAQSEITQISPFRRRKSVMTRPALRAVILANSTSTVSRASFGVSSSTICHCSAGYLRPFGHAGRECQTLHGTSDGIHRWCDSDHLSANRGWSNTKRSCIVCKLLKSIRRRSCSSSCFQSSWTKADTALAALVDAVANFDFVPMNAETRFQRILIFNQFACDFPDIAADIFDDVANDGGEVCS
jgi:hypothetical protein